METLSHFFNIQVEVDLHSQLFDFQIQFSQILDFFIKIISRRSGKILLVVSAKPSLDF